MPESFDVIVAGLGAMGSAAACHLSRRGQRVLGLDLFNPPHALGSSHGQTRIIREAYFEHPVYVPLVQRAYELWAELESISRTTLFRQTGGLMIGAPDSTIVQGALQSARTHRLPHELLTSAEVRNRFPGLHPEDQMVGVSEPRAGIVFPERCIAAHLELARAHGAELRAEEPMLRWEREGAGVRVITRRGSYSAGQLVVTAGSWVQSLFPDLGLPFRVERQILFWFEPSQPTSAFDPERCPVYLWQFDGHHFFYGFPNLGEGVKVARHHDGQATTPNELNRDVSPAEVDDMRSIVRRFLPLADGALRQATVCQYTNTPDEHFWIDRHPGCPAIWILSPCSGHGFKFSSAIGEVAADLVMTGKSRFDLGLFRSR